MMQQLDIPCGKGSDSYLVTIIGKNLRDIFSAVSGHPALKDKEGEARVKGILAHGDVSMVVRQKNGEFNDGPRGEAALVWLNTNGTLHAVRHFKNGVLNDSVKGELAVLQFNHPHGSRLIYAASFENGKRTKLLTEHEMATYPVQFYKRKSISPPAPKS